MRLCYTVATPDTRDTGMAAMRGPLPEVFATLSSLGYRAVELMVRNPAELDAREIGAAARDHGLVIPAVSTGQLRKEDRLSLNAADEVARCAAVERTRAVIDFAAEFGAQVNIGTLRGQGPAGDAVRRGLTTLLEHAAARGVRIALEPQCRYVSDWLNTVDETRAYIEGFGANHPWMLFDVYHAMLEEDSIAAAMIRARDLITWVQFSDSNRLPPGAGQTHFGEHVRVLRALGYDGCISVECMQRPDSRASAEMAARTLLPLIG